MTASGWGVGMLGPAPSTQAAVVDVEPRCPSIRRGAPCNALFGVYLTRPWKVRCRKCGSTLEMLSSM